MILALETATTACSAALCAADGSVVAERVSLDGPAHSQRLLPFVHELLAEQSAGWGRRRHRRRRPRSRRLHRPAHRHRHGSCAGAGGRQRRPRRRADARGAGARACRTRRRQCPARASCRSSTAAAARCSRPSSNCWTGAACGRSTTSRWCLPTASPPGWPLAATWSRAATAPCSTASCCPRPRGRSRGIVAPTAAMVGRAVACGAPGVVRGPDAVLPIYGRAPDATPRAAQPGAAPAGSPSGGAA